MTLAETIFSTLENEIALAKDAETKAKAELDEAQAEYNAARDAQFSCKDPDAYDKLRYATACSEGVLNARENSYKFAQGRTVGVETLDFFIRHAINTHAKVYGTSEDIFTEATA